MNGLWILISIGDSDKSILKSDLRKSMVPQPQDIWKRWIFGEGAGGACTIEPMNSMTLHNNITGIDKTEKQF